MLTGAVFRDIKSLQVVHLVHAHVGGVVRLRVDFEPHFGRRQRQRAALATPSAQDPCDPVELAQTCGHVVREPRVVDAGLRLRVRQRCAALDHAFREPAQGVRCVSQWRSLQWSALSPDDAEECVRSGARPMPTTAASQATQDAR